MIFKSFFKSVVDFIFPPQCCICKTVLNGEDGICFDCLSKMNFISSPRCEMCGFPFEFDLSFDTKHLLCARCIKKPFVFDSCVSVVAYDDFSKEIILPFKHSDKTNFAKLMGKIMANLGKDVIGKADCIIPVPIHFTRMLKRKYNQASLLSNVISDISGVPVLYDVLFRKRKTKSQGHLSVKERKRNVSGAFVVKKAGKVAFKNVLLVDDVFTTGATVNECAKILKKNGVNKVYVLTFARIIR